MKRRDIDKTYPLKQFIAKIRRFADALEEDKPFAIMIGSERIAVPARAIASIAHERGGGEEEIEFQVTWKLPGKTAVKPRKRAAKGRSSSG